MPPIDFLSKIYTLETQNLGGKFNTTDIESEAGWPIWEF